MEDKKIEGAGKYKNTWSEIHEARQRWLYNYMITLPKYAKLNLNYDSFIYDHKRDVGGVIEKNPKWGNQSKENLYFMIARFLNYNYPKDSQAVKIAKDYSAEGFKLKTEKDEREDRNELSEKEEENWRPLEYFLKLRADLKEKDGQTLNNHYDYLLLSLIVLQAPLRTSFYANARFITQQKDNDKKHNFVFIDRRGAGNVTLIVNDDKVKNSKAVKQNPGLALIKVESRELVDIIIDSFEKFKREYLFENPKTKTAFQQNTFPRWLQRITELPGINFQMMRSIFVSWSWEMFNTNKDKKKLAEQMRHSVSTAAKNYNKPTQETKRLTSDYIESLEKPQDIKQIEEEKKKIEEELEMVKEHCGSKFNPEDKLHIKRRSDILYRYNKKNVAPTDKTMKKYNIILKKGVYV